jgi:uncharacterized protein YjbI with pentapeptide repeats
VGVGVGGLRSAVAEPRYPHIVPPHLPPGPLHVPGEEILAARAGAPFEAEALAIQALHLPEGRYAPVRLEQCTLDRCTLRGCEWPGASLLDTAFTACDLANAKLTGARIRRAVFIDCRMTGVDLSEAVIEDALFVRCRLDLALFFSTCASRTAFHACDLRQSEFQGASLQSPIFRSCDLSGATFTGREALDRADLRGSTLHRTEFAPETLRARGITIDSAQAAAIAGCLGFEVREPDDEGV